MLEAAASITMVGDRESDIYDTYARRPKQVHLLSRAAQDRSLADGAKLFARCAAWAEADRYAIEVPRRGARPARRALLALRFGEVVLKRPANAARTLAKTVPMRVVEVTEIDPPADETPAGEKPVRWCLLTTHVVDSTARARAILGWCQLRWTIEQVFRTLKSAGTQAEESQVTTARRFVKLAVAALIAAVRVMQIVIGRDGATDQPLADAADPADTEMLSAFSAKLEGRTALLKNPHRLGSLAWYCWIVARLGGWSGYTSKGYKPAGPKTIARGLAKLDAMAKGWRYANHSANARLP